LGVVAAWCVVTTIAVVALARATADGVFVAMAAAYALVLLSGMLHYAFGTPMRMAARSNVTVLAEALAGAALASALLRGRAGRQRSAGVVTGAATSAAEKISSNDTSSGPSTKT
jgi:ABC-type transport system involved in cytochrome c biogenesis permease subunit